MKFLNLVIFLATTLTLQGLSHAQQASLKPIGAGGIGHKVEAVYSVTRPEYVPAIIQSISRDVSQNCRGGAKYTPPGLDAKHVYICPDALLIPSADDSTLDMVDTMDIDATDYSYGVISFPDMKHQENIYTAVKVNSWVASDHTADCSLLFPGLCTEKSVQASYSQTLNFSFEASVNRTGVLHVTNTYQRDSKTISSSQGIDGEVCYDVTQNYYRNILAAQVRKFRQNSLPGSNNSGAGCPAYN